MIQLAKIQFNPFGENTYVLTNESKEAIIVDPGCCSAKEFDTFKAYIEKNSLKPIMVVCTHGHIDHICGAAMVIEQYRVPFALSKKDESVLKNNLTFAQSLGFDLNEVPNIDVDLSTQKDIKFGANTIDIIETPGHSPGGICLWIKEQKILLTGDTLFHRSIGRSDLDGGDYDQLMNSIIKNILPFGGDVKFFPGHGSDSTLSDEIDYNPFISEVLENRVNSVYED